MAEAARNTRRERTYGMSIATLTALAAAGLSGCATSEAQPAPNAKRDMAHFAAICRDGFRLAITSVRTSGAMPKHPDNQEIFANAAVTMTCYGNKGEKRAPQLLQDAEGEGKCLGYAANQYHVMIGSSSAEDASVTFFSRAYPEEGQVDIGIAGADSITRAEMHQHDLRDSYEKDQFKLNNCQQLPA